MPALRNWNKALGPLIFNSEVAPVSDEIGIYQLSKTFYSGTRPEPEKTGDFRWNYLQSTFKSKRKNLEYSSNRIVCDGRENAGFLGRINKNYLLINIYYSINKRKLNSLLVKRAKFSQRTFTTVEN